jgi:hypothetical protein
MATGREVATNRNGQTVAEAINELLADVLDHPKKSDYEVWIATAYFNPGGFGLLADQLERVKKARLLLGAEPVAQNAIEDKPTGTAVEKKRSLIRRALEGHGRTLEEDRDLLGFSVETDAAAKRLVTWLRQGDVEVRRFEKGFLHGKAFLVPTEGEGVLAGSSNFTYAGLALNDELNLGWYQPYVVTQVREWFETLWEESSEFDLAAVYEARFEPHDPYLIYLRMLYERYGGEVEQEAAAAGQTGVHLTTFQRDGVWRAKRILDDHHGVIVADGVGLGKTFIGGAIVEEYEKQRRQRVLVIAPAALRDGPWRKFLSDHMLAAECVSYEEFAADPQVSQANGGKPILTQPIDQYSLIVVDEGHAFRNPETQRAGALRTALAGLPAKDVVLLTATPVNNNLFDLYNLISLFIKNDAAFAHRGILSLRRHFSDAAAVDPDDLSPDRLFDVLDAIAVRRTRRFVKDYYSGASLTVDGQQITITFPKVEVEAPVTYNLDTLLPGFFERVEHVLDCYAGSCGHDTEVAEAPALSLARYAPSRYLHSGEHDAYEAQLAGLLRSGLLKRFESSVHAFALTCERMAASHDSFLSLLDQGRVATGPALAEWTAAETDELDEAAVPRTVMEGSFDAKLYDTETLRADVQRDRDLLRTFAAVARKVERENDPKLAQLIEQLAIIAKEAEEEAISDEDERDNRKAIVFSYYTDTIEWIEQHLVDVLDPASPAHDERLAAYHKRMVSITGDASVDKTHVMWGFAPVSSEAPASHAEDRYDLLLSTDVLAEGVNLQQARHVINYDLPWNPMKLVQRHGRIDRIGSRHERVFVRCFFPDRQLDEILGLEVRLKRKLAQAAASVGLEAEALPGSKTRDVTFTETREEIEKLRRQDPSIFEQGGEHGDAYSGEEYRQELRKGFEDPQIAARVKNLPWGSGSGLARAGSESGFIFCARVGDHPQPQLRWVSTQNLADLGEPISDTLACLERAHATVETARVLDEETHRLGYTAWDHARRHIYEEWMRATDHRNLLPAVPKAMRDAADLLVEREPAGMTRAETDSLIEALQAPYPPRIQAVFRTILRTDAVEQQKANRIAEEARRLSLERFEPPEPLPVIGEDDIHLVCWMAVIAVDATQPIEGERKTFFDSEQMFLDTR